MVGDVVGVVFVFLRSVFVHETRQVEARTKFAQHRLEPAYVAVRFNDRPADCVCNAVGFRNRPVQKRDTIVAFKVCGVGQDQVGVGDHFR